MSSTLTNVPIPGQGLTQSPEDKLPYEMPPEHTEMNEVVGVIFDELNSKERLPSVVKLMRESKIYMDRVVSAYIEQGIIEGRWNSDMAHLLVEPVMFIFMWIGSQTGSPVVFKTLNNYDSSGMDILEAMEESDAEGAIANLLSPSNDEEVTNA